MSSYVSNMWSLALQGELQGIWFWSATYAILVCSYSFVHQLNIRSWPSTRGSLNQASITKFGYTHSRTSDQDYRAQAVYTYSVSNQKYEGHRVSPWLIIVSHNLSFILKMQLSAVKPNANGIVEVFYKPSRPGKSFLIKPGKTGLCITFMLGTGLAMSYFFRFHF